MQHYSKNATFVKKTKTKKPPKTLSGKILQGNFMCYMQIGVFIIVQVHLHYLNFKANLLSHTRGRLHP